MTFKHLLLAASATALMAAGASAETIRWARAGDALTLDPHAQNEGPTSALAHQIIHFRGDLGGGPGRRNDLDRGDQMRWVDRVNDEATPAPRDVLAVSRRCDA